MSNDKKGDHSGSGAEIKNTEVFSIRRDQVVSTVALPVLLTCIGLLINYLRGVQTDKENLVRELRQEIRIEAKEQEAIFRREIETNEKNTDEKIKSHERRLVWIEQALNDWNWNKTRGK